MVKPAGTGILRFAISARLAPLPPSRSTPARRRPRAPPVRLTGSLSRKPGYVGQAQEDLFDAGQERQARRPQVLVLTDDQHVGEKRVEGCGETGERPQPRRVIAALDRSLDLLLRPGDGGQKLLLRALA